MKRFLIILLLLVPSGSQGRLQFQGIMLRPSTVGGPVYHRTLTIDHLQVPSTQTDFPVLVKFTDTTLKTTSNGGHVQSANGYDIVFTSDSGGVTRLKWEMESYDAANGIVVAWVKIASLSSASDTVIYMFYGDASIVTDQSDRANTWDTNFKGVWHTDDNAASTTILASVGTNATNSVNTSTVTTTGQIKSALNYVAANSNASSAATNLSANNVVTLSFWMNWTTNANDDHLAFEYTSNYNSANGFLVDWNASSGFFQFGYHNVAGGYTTDHFTRPSAATWHLIHLVIDRSTQVNVAYVDGTLQTLTTDTHTDGGANTNFDNSTLYWMSRNAASLFASGTLDEVRLSTSIRAADWVTCEFNNQKASSTFVALGTET